MSMLRLTGTFGGRTTLCCPADRQVCPEPADGVGLSRESGGSVEIEVEKRGSAGESMPMLLRCAFLPREGLNSPCCTERASAQFSAATAYSAAFVTPLKLQTTLAPVRWTKWTCPFISVSST